MMAASTLVAQSLGAVRDIAINTSITEDEKAIYDRQIRLWGVEAQNRLRNSSVLIAGLSGCGGEVAKNLMLAGLKSLTLLDHKLVTQSDYSNQFFLAPNSEGKNIAEVSRDRCQVLNPNVQLAVDTDNLVNKADAFFEKFDLVILIDQRYSLVEKISQICRNMGIRFEAGGVFGWIGYAFFDFTGCSFLITKPKVSVGGQLDGDVEECTPSGSKRRRHSDMESVENEHAGARFAENVTLDVEDERVKMTWQFPPWSEAWNIDWTQNKVMRKVKRILPQSYFAIRALLRVVDAEGSAESIEVEKFITLWEKELGDCLQSADEERVNEQMASFFIGPQLNPACAIVGAVIAQEAVKALSQKDTPLRNVFLYSSLDTSGVVCLLPPA